MVPLEDIGEKVGIDKSTFRWLYVFLSSHVHGLPMSFYRVGEGPDERGRGLPSPVEDDYTSLCLSFAISLLVGARDEINTLFADFKNREPVVENDSLLHAQPQDNKTEDKFPIGAKADITENDFIRIECSRPEEKEIHTKYYDKKTNEMILHRIDSEDNGVDLVYLDPVYWKVYINNNPATYSELEKAMASPHAFRVSHDEREIFFKV